MDSQTKRSILAVVLMVGLVLGWLKLQMVLYPPTNRGPTSGPTAGEVASSTQPGGGAGSVAGGAASAPSLAAEREPSQGTSAPSTDGYVVVGGAGESSSEGVILGSDREDTKYTPVNEKNPFEYSAMVAPRGAGVSYVNLSRHRNRVAKDKKHPEPDPYNLLKTVHDPIRNSDFRSFSSLSIKIDDQDVRLNDANWTVAASSRSAEADSVALEATVRRAGEDVLRLRKTFAARPHDPELRMRLSVENVSGQAHRIIVTEAGPIGVAKDDPRIDYRRVVTAVVDPSKGIVLGPKPSRADVAKTREREQLLLPPEDAHILWSAVSNKYFTSIVAPHSGDGAEAFPKALVQVTAEAPLAEGDGDDLTFRYVLNTGQPVAAGQTAAFDVDIYLGAKSKPYMTALADGAKRDYYGIISQPDVSSCTFVAIGKMMLWLITGIHAVVHNYGVAIICLVIIVRLILHPLSKRGQLMMSKTQRGMARLKPKLDAVTEQYKNDKQRLQQETMRIYREEGVSPGGPLIGCLPTAVQIPIWGALWTMLNTNVDMRQQPFFWWIRDLSSPDALIPLPESWHFTVPLVGKTMMGGPITAINLLPIIMTITMYTQTKIMQKLTQPEKKPPPKLDADGRPMPDPMEQQQKMMPYMMVFMGLIFYNFPSGLSLYQLSSNLLGMLEQYQIRRVLRRMEERGQLAPSGAAPVAKSPSGGPPSGGPRKPSWLERFEKMAEQARTARSDRDKAAPAKVKKKSRFD